MEWRMKNGSYPYLDGFVRMAEKDTTSYPMFMWRCSAGIYPNLSWLTTPPVLGCFANAAGLQAFRFMGTTAQWESLERGACWKTNAPFDRVVCTDGTVVTS